ncbi:6420_t:CDS:2, partial [Dentiscutata erythropus]
WQSNPESRPNIEHSWKPSNQTIDDFLNIIEDNNLKSIEDFQKLVELQKDLNAQIQKAYVTTSSLGFSIVNTENVDAVGQKVVTEMKNRYNELLSDSIELKTKERMSCTDLEILIVEIKLCYDRIKHDIEITAGNVIDENIKAKQLKKISKIEELI